MSSNAAQELSNALADAVERVSASVVRVETGRRRPASGLIWSAEGLVVTSAHGLEREEGLEVSLETGQAQPATLLGSDPSSDIAVLRIEATPGLPVAERAPGESIRRGQLVLALSRPGRTIRSTLGVVSALSDQWRAPSGGKIERYIQSDVGIEAGFSGGALIDASGRVIGLNSAALLRGSALTLAVVTVERVVNALLSHGQIQRGYLGVSSTAARLPPTLAESSGQRAGLVVTGLQPGGPAENAGVFLGDVLLSLDGEPLESIADLQAALEERAQRSVALRVLRAGQAQELLVTPSVRS
ncbi:MAG TPA: trypsin-like peptidase domain-containing protein [Polyangiaceae bacterium]|nr:trypsin-like peptidase domain-containing protein [Polyangiaceae bacterium]